MDEVITEGAIRLGSRGAQPDWIARHPACEREGLVIVLRAMKRAPADSTLRATLRRVGAAAPEVIELFDYLEDRPLWMKDVAGTYQWVNVSFLLNFGLKTREEVIGHNDYDLCGEVLANQYRIDDERVLLGERILSRVELIGRFDHTARWCVTSKVPLRDAKNRIVGTAGVTRPLGQHPAGTPTDSPL